MGLGTAPPGSRLARPKVLQVQAKVRIGPTDQHTTPTTPGLIRRLGCSLHVTGDIGNDFILVVPGNSNMVKASFPTVTCNQATPCIRRPNAGQPVAKFSLHNFRPLILHNIQLTYMPGPNDKQIDRSRPKQKLENKTTNQSLIFNSFRYPTLEVSSQVRSAWSIAPAVHFLHAPSLL